MHEEDIYLEEQKPIIELPALIIIGFIIFSFCLGISLLFLPWYIPLLLFLGLCLVIAITFNLYIGVLIFLAGSYLHPTALFPVLQPFHIARNLALGVLFIWLSHVIIYRDFRIVRTPQNFFVLGFTAMLLMSSFRYFDYSFLLFIEIATKAVILYFIIVNVLKTRKEVLILLWMLIGLAVISSSVGFYQYLHGIGVKVTGSVVRIFGTTMNPNILAAELVLVLPIIIALLMNSKSKIIKFILLFFFAVVATGIVLTFSRAGMVTSVIILILSLMQFVFKNHSKPVAIVYSLLIITLGILIFLPFIPQEYWDRMRTITDMEEVSIASRLEAWKLSFEMMLKNPIFGVGFGAFKYEFLKHVLASASYNVRYIMLHAHNMYLHIGAESGALALLFFLCIIFYAWRQLRKTKYRFQKKNDVVFSQISGALEISLIGFIIMNIFSWHLDLLIFWILLGLACVLEKLSLLSDANILKNG